MPKLSLFGKKIRMKERKVQENGRTIYKREKSSIRNTIVRTEFVNYLQGLLILKLTRDS